MSTNVYAKFLCAPLQRIKKALGIFLRTDSNKKNRNNLSSVLGPAFRIQKFKKYLALITPIIRYYGRPLCIRERTERRVFSQTLFLRHLGTDFLHDVGSSAVENDPFTFS